MQGSRAPIGFELGHQPVFQVPKRKKGGTTANHVPSRKSVSGRGIRAAQPLMRDFLWHLEVDPSVRLISPYPLQLEYQTYDRYGPSGTAKHIPDLGILKRDGSVVYCDIVPEAILQEQWYRERRRPLLEEAYFDQCGAGYSILTELSIHIQPLMNNVRRLWRDSRNQEPAAMRAVRRALGMLPPTPRAIGVIADAAEYRDRNAAIACVLQLACTGYLRIDLSVPISEDTTVFLPDLMNPED